MTQQERTILEALVELDRLARSMPTSNPKPNLLPLFQRLDELTLALPADSAPDLLHYLRKKSYEKARLWLQGLDAGNARGACR